MVEMKKLMKGPAILWIGGAALLAAGAAGGAGAVGMTRPAVEVAPIRPVAVAALAQKADSLVTVRGKVAEVYGDRFTLADGSGKTMVDAGRDAPTLTAGQDVLVQGRYDNGQLHASFLIDGSGRVTPVGPAGRPPHGKGPHGPGRDGPGRDGPGREGPGRDGPPPPPEGCAPPPVAATPATK